MIDINKCLTDEDDLSFIQELRDFVETQRSVELCYFDFSFLLEPLGRRVEIWCNGECVSSYDSFDDMLLNYFLDGKPFIEQIAYIDFA